MTIHHLKILVPAAAAGRIIGKGGTTIAQLQSSAGARVKMSKASEFYPGTTERTCLISGPVEGILKINDFFIKNLHTNSFKILVPNSTAGMIIGKGGSFIKQIIEESGTFVQISQKNTDPERCVSIVGEPENMRIACAMILNKIVEDSSLTNFSTTPSPPSSTTTTTTAAATTTIDAQPHNPPIIETIKMVLQVSGYGDDAITEISSAMTTLASYGVLGLGLGLI